MLFNLGACYAAKVNQKQDIANKLLSYKQLWAWYQGGSITSQLAF